MPGWLILSISCCATSLMSNYLISYGSGCAIWFVLHDDRLLGVPYFVWCCWTLPPHVKLLDVPYIILSFLFFLSCYIIWSYTPHVTVLHHRTYLLLLVIFDIKFLIFNNLILPWPCSTDRPWLPHVVVTDVPYIRWCYLIWSAWC